jgi:hypothetical protein
MPGTDWQPVETASRHVVEIGESLPWTAGSLRLKVAYDYAEVEVPIYLFWRLETGKLLYARVTPPLPPAPTAP